MIEMLSLCGDPNTTQTHNGSSREDVNRIEKSFKK